MVAASTLSLSSGYKAYVFPEINYEATVFLHLKSILWKDPLTVKVRKKKKNQPDFELHQFLF